MVLGGRIVPRFQELTPEKLGKVLFPLCLWMYIIYPWNLWTYMWKLLKDDLIVLLKLYWAYLIIYGYVMHLLPIFVMPNIAWIDCGSVSNSFICRIAGHLILPRTPWELHHLIFYCEKTCGFVVLSSLYLLNMIFYKFRPVLFGRNLSVQQRIEWSTLSIVQIQEQ